MVDTFNTLISSTVRRKKPISFRQSDREQLMLEEIAKSNNSTNSNTALNLYLSALYAVHADMQTGGVHKNLVDTVNDEDLLVVNS